MQTIDVNNKVYYLCSINGLATASSEYAHESAANAFNLNIHSKWYNAGVNKTSGWISYKFPANQMHNVAYFSVTSANDCPERDPSMIFIYAKNKEDKWVLLNEIYNIKFYQRHQTLYFTNECNNDKYNEYKFTIINNGGNDGVQLACLNLYCLNLYEYQPIVKNTLFNDIVENNTICLKNIDRLNTVIMNLHKEIDELKVAVNTNKPDKYAIVCNDYNAGVNIEITTQEIKKYKTLNLYYCPQTIDLTNYTFDTLYVTPESFTSIYKSTHKNIQVDNLEFIFDTCYYFKSNCGDDPFCFGDHSRLTEFDALLIYLNKFKNLLNKLTFKKITVNIIISNLRDIVLILKFLNLLYLNNIPFDLTLKMNNIDSMQQIADIKYKNDSNIREVKNSINVAYEGLMRGLLGIKSKFTHANIYLNLDTPHDYARDIIM